MNARIVVCVMKASFETAKVDFLEKIFKAVHKTMDEIELLQIDGTEAMSLSDRLIDRESYEVFLFGVEPARVGLQIARRPYQIITAGNLRIVSGAELGKLSSDPKHKKALWTCLQNLYPA